MASESTIVLNVKPGDKITVVVNGDTAEGAADPPPSGSPAVAPTTHAADSATRPTKFLNVKPGDKITVVVNGDTAEGAADPPPSGSPAVASTTHAADSATRPTKARSRSPSPGALYAGLDFKSAPVYVVTRSGVDGLWTGIYNCQWAFVESELPRQDGIVDIQVKRVHTATEARSRWELYRGTEQPTFYPFGRPTRDLQWS